MNDGRPINILLVEDEPDFVNLIAHAIHELRLDDLSPFAILETTSELSTAFEILKTYSIDAVLLDLNLDDSDPAHTVAAIKAITEYSPVVVLTSISNPELPLSTIDCGAQQFISKIDLAKQLPDRLKWEINTAIRRHQREDRTGAIMKKLERVSTEMKAKEAEEESTD